MTLSDLILPVTGATLWTAAQMVVGFVGAVFVGAILLPGLSRSGYPQPDGSLKEYKLTGMTLFFVAHIVFGALVFGFGVSHPDRPPFLVAVRGGQRAGARH